MRYIRYCTTIKKDEIPRSPLKIDTKLRGSSATSKLVVVNPTSSLTMYCFSVGLHALHCNRVPHVREYQVASFPIAFTTALSTHERSLLRVKCELKNDSAAERHFVLTMP